MRQHAGRPWGWALVVTAIALAILATVTGVRDYVFRQSEYAERIQQRKIDRGYKDGYVSGKNTDRGLRVLRPPSPNSIVARGMDAVTPSFWDFGPAGVTEGAVGASLAQDAEVGPLFDLESVTRVILGVLALILALDAIGAARADGTLGALLRQPLRWPLLFAGKLAGGAIVLGTAMILVSSAAIGTVWVISRAIVSGEFIRFSIVFDLLAFLYLMAMFAVGAVISAVVRLRRTSVALGVAFACGLVLLAPQAMALGARLAAPLPPREFMERQRQGAYDDGASALALSVGSLYTQLAGPHGLEFRCPAFPQRPTPKLIGNGWSRPRACEGRFGQSSSRGIRRRFAAAKSPGAFRRPALPPYSPESRATLLELALLPTRVTIPQLLNRPKAFGAAYLMMCPHRRCV